MDWVNLLASGDSMGVSISKEIFTSIMDAIDDGVFITDHEGIVLFVNNAYLNLTSLRIEDLLNKSIQSLVKQGVFSRSVSMDVINAPKKHTILQSLKNGKELLVTGHPVFKKDSSEMVAIITSVRDITVLTQAQHAQKELEQIKRTQKKYSGTKPAPGLLEHLSESTSQTYAKANRIAQSDIKILIQGNTGTGKTVLARHIHKKSGRQDKPFLEINCATMPDGLLESELFGYVPGAFTGALQKGKKGLFEAVNGGTLFLDEVGDLPLALQAKILKVIEDNRFIPVGGHEYIYTDVRIISATHHDLPKLVTDGLFRNDLYYRLCVATLHLDDLKDRTVEIEPLIQVYLSSFNKKYNADKTYASATISLIKKYAWPGNIRELTNFIEQTVVMSQGNIIQPEDIPENIRKSIHAIKQNSRATNVGKNLKSQLAEFEFDIISRTLAEFKTTYKAAEILGIDQSTLVKKRQRFLNQQYTCA